ncbi:MAG: hypothetical protein JRD89_02450 [Deltaproteobacteria bacterium]|nr:hypothetical protein [Deltaproteobacteria bacterium]
MAIADTLFRAARNVFGWVTDSREDEPTEEADATSSDATATACEIDPTDREGEADEAEFVARDEITEAFPIEPIVMVTSPEDGMPVPANESADLAYAAPFTIDNVVCVEDTRTYVEVFREELRDRGWYRHESAEDTEWPALRRAYCFTGDNAQWLAVSARSRYEDVVTDNGDSRRVFRPATSDSAWRRAMSLTPTILATTCYFATARCVAVWVARS